MHVEQSGMGVAVYGPSQYFTLDSVCYAGCQETGAGNCAEICQLRSDRYLPADGGPYMENPKWYEGPTKPPVDIHTPPEPTPSPGLSNTWLLGGVVAAVVVLMVARN